MEFLTQFKPNTPGAFLNVPMDVYQAAPGESKSSLDLLVDSPIDYRRTKDGLIPKEVTDAMEFGTILHGSVFEGQRSSYHVRPATYSEDFKPWNGNAKLCKDWLDAHQDKPVLTADRAAYVKSATEYVRSHPKCAELINGGHAEVSCFAYDEETGLLLKGRMDYVIPGEQFFTVPDLKTTADASTEEFRGTISKRRYHVQAAIYRRILRALGAPDVRFYFIALQTRALPKVNVRELNPRAMDLGDTVLDDDLMTLKACRESHRWPEWRDESPTGAVQHIDLPDFAYSDEELLTGMTPTKAA
jgi:hypothetical protein